MVSKLVLILALLCAACNHVPNPEAAANRYMEYTPANVAGSVYKIEGRVAGVSMGSGTAWKVAEDFLITAGHVCDTAQQNALTLVVISGAAKYERQVTIERSEYNPLSSEIDLCLLYAPGIPGAPLTRIAEPQYGDQVCYTGAPLGIWGYGLIPHNCGPYQGSNYVMLLAERGASGSPMYTKDGVVGVLVSMSPGFTMFHYVPASRLKRFLEGE